MRIRQFPLAGRGLRTLVCALTLGLLPGCLDLSKLGMTWKISLTKVASVDISNNTLTIRGASLDGVTGVKITGQGTETRFKIVSQSATKIEAKALTNLQLSLGALYNLIVTSAGAADIPITFTATAPFSIPGIIESKSGGFKFPDGTTQTSAASPSCFGGTCAGDTTYSGTATFQNSTAVTGAAGTTPFRVTTASGNLGIEMTLGASQGATLNFVQNSSQSYIAMAGSPLLRFWDTSTVGLVGNLSVDGRVIRGTDNGSTGQGLVTIRGGNVSGTNQNGGNVVVYGGTPNGTGADGNVILGHTGSAARGTVGIATATPSANYRLDVNGVIRVNRSTEFPTDEWTSSYISENFTRGIEASGDFRTTGKIFTTNGAYYGATHVLLRPSGIIVQRLPGSGTTSTARYLTVNNNAGGVLRDVWDYNTCCYTSANSYYSVDYGIGTWFWRVNAGAADTIYASNGNVGIGTSTLSYKLDVNGTIRGYGITDSSDLRLKKDVTLLDPALQKLLRLKPITFTWKDPARDPERQIGFVAQDVERVYPELVKTDREGMKSVNYSHLVAPIVRALQELFAKMSGQEERLTRLEAENAQLKAYVCKQPDAPEVCRSGTPSLPD